MSSTDQDSNKDATIFCSDEILNKVKEQLEQSFEKNKELIDQDDFKSLMNDSNLLKRYIKRKRNQVEASVHFIFEALQWRKRQVCNYSETDFPREFYEFGGLYLHGRDIHGRLNFNFINF